MQAMVYGSPARRNEAIRAVILELERTLIPQGGEIGAKKAPQTMVSWRIPRLALLKSLLATAPFGPVLRSFSTFIIGKVEIFVNGMNVTAATEPWHSLDIRLLML